MGRFPARPPVIRPMVPDDAPAVCWIAGVALGSGRGEGEWRRDLEHPAYRLRVAEGGARVVGFSACSVAAGECTVMHIAVAPECRSAGIGRALLQAALDDARSVGATRAVLEVRRSNRAALALYKHFGFHIVGERVGYYRGPTEDALVMQAAL